jgi:hypothetical protein
MTESARLLIGERWSSIYVESWSPPEDTSLDVYRIEDAYDRLDGLAVADQMEEATAFVAPRSGSTPHGSRRTFASDLFDAGVNAVQVGPCQRRPKSDPLVTGET